MKGILRIVVAGSILTFQVIETSAQEPSPAGKKPRVLEREGHVTSNSPEAAGVRRLKGTDFTMVPLGTESGEDDDPALVRARDGSFHLAWLSKRTGNAEIFTARSADGLSWGKYPRGVTNWTDRIGAAGWSPRVVATGTPRHYLMVSVSRSTGTPKLYCQVFRR